MKVTQPPRLSLSRAQFLGLTAMGAAVLVVGPTASLAAAGSSAVRQVLAALQLGGNPKSYAIATITFQGKQRKALLHTNTKSGLKRIDAMWVPSVTNPSEGTWYRGLYYTSSGYSQFGGMVIDGVLDNGERLGFTEPGRGPDAIYRNLLIALAHQKGISVDSSKQQIQNNNGVIEISTPKILVDHGMDSRAPSYLQMSEPQALDLKLPLRFSFRDKGQMDGLGEIPDLSRVYYSDQTGQDALFLRSGQLTFNNYTVDKTKAMHPTGTYDQGNDMLISFFTLGLTPDFKDTFGRGNAYLDKLYQHLGTSWEPADAQLHYTDFTKVDAAHTKVTWSILSSVASMR
jgi:hypothetical protein